MDTIRIDILNPKARKLLEDLEALNLISIQKDNVKSLKQIVARLRDKSEARPSLDEITQEVEKVRSNRYGKKS
ncbi:MAG: hypothetical protein RLO81_19415 [Fulvivirga sp.]|uniref:hypothetical protein n=1 Tax=Fulvivirga sp. TaxID=1931237 RepID=UPI0032EADFA3